MPIHCPIVTKRIAQAEFKQIASEVMHHVFAIHREFGRFFDEHIYKKELASRVNDVQLELAVKVTHGTFLKTYNVDVLVSNSGLFEFKATDAIHPRHRGQTLNYLLLLDLAHGKVINVRPRIVGHEFVNSGKRLIELRKPVVLDQSWDTRIDGADQFREQLMLLIEDWGAGLETSLYKEALIHFLGGEAAAVLPIPVMGRNGLLSSQRMMIVTPNVAFAVTALQTRLDEYATQTRKLIQHTNLKAVLWANITQSTITFTSLT